MFIKRDSCAYSLSDLIKSNAMMKQILEKCKTDRQHIESLAVNYISGYDSNVLNHMDYKLSTLLGLMDE